MPRATSAAEALPDEEALDEEDELDELARADSSNDQGSIREIDDQQQVGASASHSILIGRVKRR